MIKYANNSLNALVSHSWYFITRNSLLRIKISNFNPHMLSENKTVTLFWLGYSTVQCTISELWDDVCCNKVQCGESLLQAGVKLQKCAHATFIQSFERDWIVGFWEVWWSFQNCCTYWMWYISGISLLATILKWTFNASVDQVLDGLII